MSRPPTVFWGNERVTHKAIIAEQRAATVERIDGEVLVLMVQDTTSFDFSHHPAASGMGTLDNKYCQGFLAHSTLAVSEQGVPLGLVEQQVWIRPEEETGKSQQRHSVPFDQKESYKWVAGLPEQGVSARQQWVTVCDREAHIYEFLDVVLEQGGDFIVRASQGRSFTEDGDDLFEQMGQQDPQQLYSLSLKRRPDREARLAQVELRFGSLTLKRPKRADTERMTLSLQVVDVFEPEPPAGEEAIHWLLLTSLPIHTPQQAQQIITWYSYRWLIERFHYVLKSGCKLEESQLRAENRLERLLAVYSLVAWKLLWLTYQARQTPHVPCTVILLSQEWHALYAYVHRTQRLPPNPPTLHQAVHWIAQLGGFLGRKGDGEPGVKVLWRGWSRFQDILATWIISHPSPSKDVGNA
jgi:hypothetical protein